MKSRDIKRSERLDSSRIFEGDRTLWIIYAVLIVVSILVVYSSTAKMAYDVTSRLTTTESLRQQIMYVLVMSLPLIFIAHKINYNFYRYTTRVGYWLFIILTVATYFIGATTNGAARWLAIGPIQFQPSEGLKIFTILMLARCMEKRQDVITKIKLLPTSLKLSSPEQKRILRENSKPLLGPIILSCVVIAPAHISSAVIVGMVSVIMLYIGRVPKWEIFRFCTLTVIAAVVGFSLTVEAQWKKQICSMVLQCKKRAYQKSLNLKQPKWLAS